jgi:hypothetical protein
VEDKRVKIGLIALCALLLLVIVGKVLLVAWSHCEEGEISFGDLLRDPELRNAFLVNVFRESMFPLGVFVLFAVALLLTKAAEPQPKHRSGCE